jgi:hypothetical protein
MRTAVIVAAVLGLAATSAWAQSDADKPHAATPVVSGVKVTGNKDPETIVCVHHDPSGSRIPGPTECHPRRVWDQMAADARDQARGIQQRSFYFKNNQ